MSLGNYCRDLKRIKSLSRISIHLAPPSLHKKCETLLQDFIGEDLLVPLNAEDRGKGGQEVVGGAGITLGSLLEASVALDSNLMNAPFALR